MQYGFMLRSYGTQLYGQDSGHLFLWNCKNNVIKDTTLVYGRDELLASFVVDHISTREGFKGMLLIISRTYYRDNFLCTV